GRSKVESRVFAGDDVERPAGRKLDDRRKREVAEETLEGAVAGLAAGRLKNGAGHPAVPLVVHGVSTLEEREAAVLGLERRLQVGRVVQRMGERVAREQLEALREALRQIKREG